MALLGEAAALLRVEVHIVDIQGGGRKGLGNRSRRGTDRRLGILTVLPRLKVHVNANFVVLEGNEGDGHTRIAAEPELEGNVQRLGGRTGAGDARNSCLAGHTQSIQRLASATLHEHKVVGVTYNVLKSLDGSSIRRKLGPDLHPVTILAVNALATDFNLDLLDEAVTDKIEPAETLVGSSASDHKLVTSRNLNLGEHNLDVRLVHQVGVTVDDSRHTLVEVGLTVEGHLNGLHSEVRVTLVQNLPERNLGVARDINILRTIRDKLH